MKFLSKRQTLAVLTLALAAFAAVAATNASVAASSSRRFDNSLTCFSFRRCHSRAPSVWRGPQRHLSTT